MKTCNSVKVLGIWLCATWLPLAEGSELCVQVKDLAHAALPDAIVTIICLEGRSSSVQVTTDADGIACNKWLREGAYRVDVWKPGFLHASFQTVRVHPEAPGKLLVVLPFGEIKEGGIRTSALLSGTLRDSTGPISEAKICIFLPKMDKPLSCVDTSTLGEYAFSVEPGEYVVEISHGGRKSDRIKLSVPSVGVFRNRIRPNW